MGMRGILLLAGRPLHASMVSLSTGDILVEGRFATYELRMPIYEIQHVKDPEPALFANIHFRSSGAEPRLREQTCSIDAPANYFKSIARDERPSAVGVFSVEY